MKKFLISMFITICSCMMAGETVSNAQDCSCSGGSDCGVLIEKEHKGVIRKIRDHLRYRSQCWRTEIGGCNVDSGCTVETSNVPVSAIPGAPVAAPKPQKVEAPKPAPAPQKVQAPKPAPAPQKVEAPKPAPAPQKVEAPKPAPKPQKVQAPKPAPAPQKVEAPKPAPAPQKAKLTDEEVSKLLCGTWIVKKEIPGLGSSYSESTYTSDGNLSVVTIAMGTKMVTTATWKYQDGVLTLTYPQNPTPSYIVVAFRDNDTMETRLRMTPELEKQVRETQEQLDGLDTTGSAVNRLDPEMKQPINALKNQDLGKLIRQVTVCKRKK